MMRFVGRLLESNFRQLYGHAVIGVMSTRQAQIGRWVGEGVINCMFGEIRWEVGNKPLACSDLITFDKTNGKNFSFKSYYTKVVIDINIKFVVISPL